MTDRKCKVLWLFRNFYPDLAGGAERYKRYIPGLVSRNIEIEVITATQLHQEYKEISGAHILRLEISESIPSQIDHRLVRQAFKRVAESDYQYQALQLSVVQLPDIPYLLWLRLHGVKIVLACTIIESRRNRPKSLARAFYRWMFDRATHGVCSNVIVMSSQMAQARIEEGAFKKQLRIISNGVDIELFKPSSSDEKAVIRRLLGIPDGAKVLLYMGGIVPRKRVHVLIQAFLELLTTHPDVKLYLVGPTVRPTMFHEKDQQELMLYQKSLMELVGDHREQTIHFRGPTDEPQSWFKVADIFGFCPVNEGMPNVMLEAMSSGTPVVTTPFIGLSQELGEPGKQYLLANDSVSSFAATFRELLNNDEQRRHLSTQARLWIQNHHSREKTLDALADLYQGRVNQSHSQHENASAHPLI